MNLSAIPNAIKNQALTTGVKIVLIKELSKYYSVLLLRFSEIWTTHDIS